MTDCCVTGKKEGALQAKDEMQTHFECDDIGELKEHVGCKINCKPHRGHLRVAQPALLQSFEDELNLPKGKAPTLPASPGESLTKESQANSCHHFCKQLVVQELVSYCI